MRGGSWFKHGFNFFYVAYWIRCYTGYEKLYIIRRAQGVLINQLRKEPRCSATMSNFSITLCNNCFWPNKNESNMSKERWLSEKFPEILSNTTRRHELKDIMFNWTNWAINLTVRHSPILSIPVKSFDQFRTPTLPIYDFELYLSARSCFSFLFSPVTIPLSVFFHCVCMWLSLDYLPLLSSRLSPSIPVLL